MNYEVRPLGIDDLEEFYHHRCRMVELNKNSDGAYFTPREYPKEKNVFISEMKDSLFGDKTMQYSWGVFVDQKILGTCDLFIYKRPQLQHRVSFGIGIEKSLQGKGLGKEISLIAINFAKDLGAEYIDLGVLEGNIRAKSLYESLGFNETGFVEDNYRIHGSKVGHYTMALKL